MRSLSMGGGVKLPNVSYCEKENEVHYNQLIPQPNNEIWYTTTNEETVTIHYSSYHKFVDADGNEIPIISNTYENGKGIIKLEKDCYEIQDPFNGCTSLRSITLPNSVTGITISTFSDCTSLTNIVLSNNLTLIGQYAFRNCTSLTKITIPDSVTAIGAMAFQKCSNLTEIAIPDKVTSISLYAFSDCSSLTGITIPDKVTSIGNGAFKGWTKATSTENIIFPNENLKIKYFENSYCFSGWKSLTSVAIPNGVTKIGEHAFEYCSSLTGITIPNSVTTIDSYAFNYFAYNVSITILSKNPPALNNKALSESLDVVIYVPSDSIAAYKTADGWSAYASRIQAIPE